ncbi:putative Zn finger-like uncharacterized protein [Geothermobacter ehrlichii]|uniref:Putative Zn finger-like uncharacterized protein n=1 Tax=Geothermobacter ehrlichii TaxID=213224 RepID=A0A5D3WP68_9BACT|nr:response regulator [Geothermobacter ehrlichii]TYP00134.1 putative Zn finger-like uncharacterized protein [Geothermobacter ehrlichii]
MIVNCPSCASRIRLDAARHAGKRLRVRCPRCRSQQTIDVPAAAVGCGVLDVVVAHSDAELCATIQQILEQDAIACRICYSGSQALALMEDKPPRVAVMDVALPDLFAFQVVEQVRERPGLRDVRIILLSSVYNRTAYKRRPTSLYGADDYIEKHHIPDDLVPKIRALAAGLPTPGIRPPENEQQKLQWDAVSRKIRLAEQKETEVSLGDPEMEKARRLARIIASDIALYHQDKVERGLREGNLDALFQQELQEGERIFLERFGGSENLARKLILGAFLELLRMHSLEKGT